MKSYREVLKDAKAKAKKSGKEESAVDLLFLHFANLEAKDLYLQYEEEMPEKEEEAF